MREVKFRAWDEDKKQMLEPQDLSVSRKYWKWLGQYDYPLMQYTGLKDKNGVEIWEGDVVKHTYWRYPKVKTSELGVVSYCDREARFEFCLSLNTPLLELEVIGNIHENPELLENNND